MLIKDAEIYPAGLNDLRINEGVITDIGRLSARAGEAVLEAKGGALLPGLNDHHIHFLSYAASLASVDCSPSAATNSEGLAKILQQHGASEAPPSNQNSSVEWLRGIRYHESVAGDIDCRWLDRHCPNRPARIQHRSGRLWIFNSAGLSIIKNALQATTVSPALPIDSLQTGRFFDADQTLATLLGRHLPPVKLASEKLASYGVTGISDMTPTNNLKTFEQFQQWKLGNSILQHVQAARHSAFDATNHTAIISGPVKIHLHENRLPSLEELVNRIHSSHAAGVAVAIHSVTEIELMFSLMALEEAGPIKGDRIEHASVTPEHTLDRMLQLGVTVVTQPHFILEKGDTYLHDVDSEDHNALYRCNSFLKWKIPLAGSSDAPFGTADPWTTMRAAISRQTASGKSLGPGEALTPEQALALYLGSLETPGQIRTTQPGAVADICLLKHPWEVARTRLTSVDIQCVMRQGEIIYKSQPE